ncbi:helix-turn-helix domain-containing protein [Thauera sp. SDU_THAU2]|uniref:helix-turn-helix domain-containing protein n=1 Tax=Thauera sp. SDU_THAU2 TaxID=3136633 RepID=UPI00311FDA6F
MANTPNQSKRDESAPKRERKAKQASDEKWGTAVMKLGFCIIPSVLLRAQQRLGLNPTQLAVLLQLVDHWWDQERKPYPSKQSLSDRLGLGTRQIQRYIAELEAAGFVKRIERRATHRGKLSNEYDLSGLVERLNKLAPEIEEANEFKRQAMRRGGSFKSRMQDLEEA